MKRQVSKSKNCLSFVWKIRKQLRWSQKYRSLFPYYNQGRFLHRCHSDTFIASFQVYCLLFFFLFYNKIWLTSFFYWNFWKCKLSFKLYYFNFFLINFIFLTNVLMANSYCLCSQSLETTMYCTTGIREGINNSTKNCNLQTSVMPPCNFNGRTSARGKYMKRLAIWVLLI